MLLRIRSALGLLVVLALLLAMAPANTSRAVTLPLTHDEANGLLQAYGIVVGDPDGNLRLNDTLTRAEAAAIFVRALGLSARAEAMASSVPFTDVQGHWAAGVVAAANQIGLVHGDGDGRYRPDDNITYAEVITVLLRMVQHEPTGPWNPEAILITAEQFGMVPARVQARQPAIRGEIFWSLATAISRVPLLSGKTVLQTYLDSVPPQLTLDQNNVTTTNETVPITGVASEAVQVTVDGKAASFEKESRRFSYTASLSVGTNSLTVTAVDLAGNSSSVVFAARRDPAVSRIEISGPAKLQANTSVTLTVTAYDSRGRSVPKDSLTAELTGGVASFDLASGRLTADNKGGHGVLTLRAGDASKSFSFDVSGPSTRASKLTILPINSGRAPAIGKETRVAIQIVDSNGKLVADDNGRSVTLRARGLSGVTVTPGTATTEGGAATFTIQSDATGEASLTASANGLPSETATVQFLTSPRIVLSATPATLVPDGASEATIRATLQDENGTAVRNKTGSDIELTLKTTGDDEQLTDAEVSIPPNATSSAGHDGTFRAGLRTGTFTITADPAGTREYSIQPATLSLSGPLPGATLQVTASSTRQAPGATVPVTVKVLDDHGQLVKSGSYAFQLRVTTTNDEPVTDGLPEGTTLTFTGSSLTPVDDLVGRTYQGTATLNLTYGKSGVVTITPVRVGAEEAAYHNSAGYGPAAASSSLDLEPARVTFAGTPTRIQVTADSSLGKDQPGGAVKSAGNMTIRARVVDASGTPISGYTSSITLTRSTSGKGVTHISGVSGNSTSKNAVNGVAEFTVQASSTAGYDLYTASSGSLTSARIEVAVRPDKAEVPTIAAIRGAAEDDLSPTTGFVAPDDDYMDIQLHSQTPPISGDPNYWVTAKVYRKGETTVVFTSDAIDLASDLSVVRVPRSKLRAGTATYEVSINNSAGDTGHSADLGLSSVVVATYSTSYTLKAAFLDAATGKLFLSASGLANTGTLMPEKLAIVKGDESLPLDSSVAVESISSTGAMLALGDLMEMIDPDKFNGTVTLEAEDGWFTSADGGLVAKGSKTTMIKPMAHLTAATLDAAGGKLYLQGAGLGQGTLSLDLISIQQDGETAINLSPGSTTDKDRLLTGTTDSQAVIALSKATQDQIDKLEGADIYIVAQTGWLKVTAGGATYSALAVQGEDCKLFVRATLTSAQYDRSTNTLTLRGSGLAGDEVYPNHLLFQASGTSTEWHPSSTARVSATSDTTVKIEFSDTDASQFESKFSGRNVFLNTQAGWLADSQGREAAPLSRNSVLFSVPAH